MLTKATRLAWRNAVKTCLFVLWLCVAGCRTNDNTSAQSNRLELAAGEQVLDEVGANLKRGVEAVGGTLTITSQRVFFQPHALNFQKQRETIFLTEVAEVRPISFRAFTLPLADGIVIELTSGRRLRFVVDDRDKVLELLKKVSRKANEGTVVGDKRLE